MNIDLVMTMDLELVEAICGFQKTIETLDGRILVVSTIPGEVIRPGDVKCIMNEGMPIHRNPTEKGRLAIQFSIKFPKTIAPEIIPRLETCFPPRAESIIPDDSEEVVLQEFDQKQQNRRQESYYDDDEPRSSGVQCQSH